MQIQVTTGGGSPLAVTPNGAIVLMPPASHSRSNVIKPLSIHELLTTSRTVARLNARYVFYYPGCFAAFVAEAARDAAAGSRCILGQEIVAMVHRRRRLGGFGTGKFIDNNDIACLQRRCHAAHSAHRGLFNVKLHRANALKRRYLALVGA